MVRTRPHPSQLALDRNSRAHTNLMSRHPDHDLVHPVIPQGRRVGEPFLPVCLVPALVECLGGLSTRLWAALRNTPFRGVAPTNRLWPNSAGVADVSGATDVGDGQRVSPGRLVILGVIGTAAWLQASGTVKARRQHVDIAPGELADTGSRGSRQAPGPASPRGRRQQLIPVPRPPV